MRVTKYDMLLNEEQHPYLVKEESRNCPDVDKMTSPEKIKMLHIWQRNTCGLLP